MVKVKPCPHVHAGGALVHQAEQARSLNARLRGGRGGISAPSRSGGWASGAPHARTAGRACLSINKLQNPKKPVYHEGVGLPGGRYACLTPPSCNTGGKYSPLFKTVDIGNHGAPKYTKTSINDCTHPHPHP